MQESVFKRLAIPNNMALLNPRLYETVREKLFAQDEQERTPEKPLYEPEKPTEQSLTREEFNADTTD